MRRKLQHTVDRARVGCLHADKRQVSVLKSGGGRGINIYNVRLKTAGGLYKFSVPTDLRYHTLGIVYCLCCGLRVLVSGRAKQPCDSRIEVAVHGSSYW